MNRDNSAASKAWKHVAGASDEEKKRNPYLNPPARRTPESPHNIDDFIKMENLTCHDSEGKITEQYPVLYVAKDVFRKKDENYYQGDKNKKVHMQFNVPEAITFCESKGLFLPSMPLTFAMLFWLYEHKDKDPAAKEVLNQYKDIGPLWSMYPQNTVVDKQNESNKVIHYPKEIGGAKVNSLKTSIELSFTSRGRGYLESFLSYPLTRSSIQNLTGLLHPEWIVGISKYFGYKTFLDFHINPTFYSTLIGCTSLGREAEINFNIILEEPLSGAFPARGVFAGKSPGEAFDVRPSGRGFDGDISGGGLRDVH